MNLKSRIEFMVEQILLEIRSNFKWQEFKKIDKLREQEKYLDFTGTKVLGEGSSRITYLLSNRFVLKLAVPQFAARGRAQNKEEVIISHDPLAKDFVTRVYDYDKDYNWIVADLVRPLKSKEEFEKLTGVNFDIFETALLDLYDWGGDLNALLDYYRTRLEAIRRRKANLGKNYEQMIGLLESNKWLKRLCILLERNAIEAGDIAILDHWGKTPDGRVVILDYGFTDSVARQYYS